VPFRPSLFTGTQPQAFRSSGKRHSACGIHSLAEVYAVMTALPVKPMIPREQALLLSKKSAIG
jgi:hypothetical protein